MHSLSLQNLATARPAAARPRLPLRDRRRADRLRHDRAQRQGHPPGRAGPAPARRHLHRPVQPARLAPDHPGRRRQPRRRRGADDRPGRRTQHQGTRADDPRRQRDLTRLLVVGPSVIGCSTPSLGPPLQALVRMCLVGRWAMLSHAVNAMSTDEWTNGPTDETVP